MSNPEIFNTIKSTVNSLLPDSMVLLFGSRARGDFNMHSDFDVLVITKKTFPLGEKRNWRTRINDALVMAIHAPVDVLLNSEEEVNVKKEFPGHIVRWALKEGIIL